MQESELRWRKAQLARDILKEMFERQSVLNALLMLDWSGRTYDIGHSKSAAITRSEVMAALRTDNLNFTDKEAFVRDCFDSLFDVLEQIEHHLRTQLVAFDDIMIPLDYWVSRLMKDHSTVIPYCQEYGFDLVPHLLNRFKANS